MFKATQSSLSVKFRHEAEQDINDVHAQGLNPMDLYLEAIAELTQPKATVCKPSPAPITQPTAIQSSNL